MADNKTDNIDTSPEHTEKPESTDIPAEELTTDADTGIDNDTNTEEEPTNLPDDATKAEKPELEIAEEEPTNAPNDVTEAEEPAAEATEEEPTSNETERLPFEETLEELGLDVNWQRPITPEDIAYLYERRPFIQLTTADGVEAYDEPKISFSKAGWVIINYGDALCCSPGLRLFNYAGLKHRSDDDDDGRDETPVGTIKGQTFLTAGELIVLAKAQGWQNIHVIDGLPAMIWATWIHATSHDIVLSNYNPTLADEEMRDRLKRDQDTDRRYALGAKKFK